MGRELWLPGGRRWCLSEHRGVRGRRDFPEGLHGSLLLLPVLPLPSASSRAWDNACATGTDTQLSPELREGWLLPGWHCGGCRHRNDPTSCCPWHPEASLSLGPLEWTLSTETPGLGCQRGADPHGACPQSRARLLGSALAAWRAAHPREHSGPSTFPSRADSRAARPPFAPTCAVLPRPASPHGAPAAGPAQQNDPEQQWRRHRGLGFRGSIHWDPPAAHCSLPWPALRGSAPRGLSHALQRDPPETPAPLRPPRGRVTPGCRTPAPRPCFAWASPPGAGGGLPGRPPRQCRLQPAHRHLNERSVVGEEESRLLRGLLSFAQPSGRRLWGGIF